jgi:deoxyribonuclease-4
MPEAVARARAVEATALQVFVKSSNQWAARPFADGEVAAFRRAAEASGLARHTIAHASYLVNLASPDEALWDRSVRALAEELSRCEALGVGALVVHPGAHMGEGEEAGLRRVTAALDRILAGGGNDSPVVLLEITAGQGSCLGASFEQLAWVLERARRAERLGVCFDTCHALAAGYEFRDARSYRETMERLHEAIGIERVKAFHLNDSKNGIGSRKDRHAHIGHGEVGLEAFRLLLNDSRFRGVPMVLETPKGDDLEEDRVNLGVLRGLVGR